MAMAMAMVHPSHRLPGMVMEMVVQHQHRSVLVMAMAMALVMVMAMAMVLVMEMAPEMVMETAMGRKDAARGPVQLVCVRPVILLLEHALMSRVGESVLVKSFAIRTLSHGEQQSLRAWLKGTFRDTAWSMTNTRI
jgi:hypothetical protein